MTKKGLNFTLLLIVLVSCTYLLRLNNSSFTRFLQEELAELPIDEPLCEGVTITPATESELQDSEEIRSAMNSIEPTNHLMVFIEGSEPKDHLLSGYVGPLVVQSVQWLVFFGIGLIVLLVCVVIFILAWCSARKRLREGKVIYVGNGTKVYLAMSILFLIPLLGADIASLIFTTTQLEPASDKLVCSIAIFGDQCEYGNLEEHWIGTVPLNSTAVAAIFLIPNTTQNLSYTTGSTDQSSVNAAFTTASGSVTVFYEDNEGQTIERADPAFTTAYIPTYIENLGPPSNNSTESGEILAEMQDKRDRVVGASQNVSSAISQLQLLAQFPAISGPILENAIIFANEAALSCIVATDKLKVYAHNFGEIVDHLVIAMVVVLSVDIGFVVVALSAIVLLYVGVKWARRAVHLSWCILGILMLFTWVLSTILWASAIAVNDVCNTADIIIVDPVIFNTTANKFFPDTEYGYAKELLYTCLHGDGDILKTLGQKENLAPYESLFLGLNNVANLTEAIQPVPDSIVIPEQQFLVSQIEVGLISDDPLTDTDLVKLNSFTSSATNGCTQVEDTWILNSGNCTAAMGTVFVATNTPDFNVGNPTCIGFDAWGTKEIDVRYNNETFSQPPCGLIDGDDADVDLTNYIDSFVVHQQNVAIVFGNVQSGLNDVAAANVDYMNTITTATANIAPVYNQTSQIYPLMGSTETGILFNSDCSFLVDTYKMVQDQACVFFLPGIYRTMITLLVASFTGLFAVPFLFLFSKKLLLQRKQDTAIEMGRQSAGAYKA